MTEQLETELHIVILVEDVDQKCTIKSSPIGDSRSQSPHTRERGPDPIQYPRQCGIFTRPIVSLVRLIDFGPRQAYCILGQRLA
jgi:hypothetical protein